MSHKIRKAMGEKDAAYLLGGTVDKRFGLFVTQENLDNYKIEKSLIEVLNV